tara:strand:- start:5449 stop:5631 length:183 start_codon:yes stop_codon:yes gene_type:complete
MKKENNKKPIKWDSEEPKIKSTKKSRKIKRHSSKENLKDLAQGNLDYEDYMEMEDWSDSR